MNQRPSVHPDPLRTEGLEGVERLFGVIGWPVVHSMSPAIHNAAFAECGLPYRYRLFPVPPSAAELAAFLKRCAHNPIPVGGCSVTIPHKRNALSCLRGAEAEIEPLAERIGAVNTLVRAGGGFAGYNTDYAAAVEAISSAFGGDRAKLAGRRVLLLGAGGAGRAIAFGLAEAGCRVTLTDLERPLAEALAEDVGGAAVDPARAAAAEADILVNATPVGMHPHVDRSPFPAAGLRSGMVVFDAVYNPMRTRLLAEAEAAGCRCVGGVTMFVAQAVAQFELWTDRPAPRERMRRVVEDRLRRGPG